MNSSCVAVFAFVVAVSIKEETCIILFQGGCNMYKQATPSLSCPSPSIEGPTLMHARPPAMPPHGPSHDQSCIHIIVNLVSLLPHVTAAIFLCITHSGWYTLRFVPPVSHTLPHLFFPYSSTAIEGFRIKRDSSSCFTFACWKYWGCHASPNVPR
jgi:hypothetical protein